MAIFDTTEANVVPASPFTPQEAVVDQSASALVQGVGGLLNTVGNIHGEKVKREEAMVSGAMLTDFSQNVSKFARAVQQGRMTSAQAKVKINQRLNEAAAQNPDLWEDLITRRNDILSESGLGAEIRTGTVQEQARKKLEGELYERGVISTSATQEEVAQAVDDFQAVKRAEDQLRQAQAQASLQSTQLGNQSSQLTLQQRRTEMQQQDALFNLVTSYTPVFSRTTGTILQQFQAGQLDETSALQLLDEKWSEVVQTRNMVGDKVSKEYVERVSWGMDQIKENTRKAITGEITIEALGRQNEKILLLQQNDFLKDPYNAASIAVQRLVPHSQLLGNITEINTRVLAHVRKNDLGTKASDLFDPDPATRKDAEGYLGVMRDAIKAHGRGDLDENDTQLLFRQLESIVKGADVYSGIAENASEFVPLMRFFASDEFGKLAAAGEGVPEGMAERLGETMFRQYEEMVIPAIKREFESGAVGGTPMARGPSGVPLPQSPGQNISDVIETSWRGGLMFRIKDDADFGVFGNKAQVQAKASRLNKVVSSRVNELVKAQAHAQGHKNYRKTYEELYSHLFGVENPEESGATE